MLMVETANLDEKNRRFHRLHLLTKQEIFFLNGTLFVSLVVFVSLAQYHSLQVSFPPVVSFVLPRSRPQGGPSPGGSGLKIHVELSI